MHRAIRVPVAAALVVAVACAGAAQGASRTGRSPSAELKPAIPALRAQLAAITAGTFADGQRVRLTGRAAVCSEH